MTAHVIRAALVPGSRVFALAAVAGTVALAVLAAPVRADEIKLLDPATCAPSTKTVAEVTEETWLQVSYREKAGGKIERVDTRLVSDVKRSGDEANATILRSAMSELANANYAGARQGFGAVAHGGRTQDATSGKIEYKPFAPEPGKSKWTTEYALYHYALASYREGVATGTTQLIEDALQALDADSAGEKGFLARYKEGKSRFYADAWLLKGQAQIALKKYDEAAATLDALYQKSLTTPIGVRFSCEAKLAPGRIAEAKGDLGAAEQNYDASTAAIGGLFDQATDACSRILLGKYYSEARIQKARILRIAAEKPNAGAEFARLRAYLLEGSPDALRAKFAGKSAEILDALVAGAMAPSVQAVAQNGIGLAAFQEKRMADAIAAFTAVRVKYFAASGDEVPRALHYLVRASEAAAATATKADAKAIYVAQAESARQEITSARWRTTTWATTLPAPAGK